MDMGHLYHDAVYGDPILALDVKEQLRTREINACEETNLARKSQIYDRAKDLCEKTAKHEKWRVGQTINMILERSPHLERSLASEKARLEMLHNILVRRQAAKKAKEEGSTYTPTTTTASPVSRSTLSSKRPDTRKGSSALKGIGRRRRQDREKSKKRRRKEDGPILNTDFSLERHLPKASLYSKRNEHAVKTLAKISWQMETRKRDHRRFQENLVHFSKPMMERARMVLRGRPDIDVEQFLKEFEDFLYPQEKAGCKVNNRKVKRKRISENENSVPSDEPSQGTLVQQNGDEEDDDYLPLNTAESTFVGAFHDSNHQLLLHDSSNLSNEQKEHFNPLSEASYDSLVQELPSRLHNLTLIHSDEDRCGHDTDLEDVVTNPPKTRPGSEREGSFRLPAIVATKSDVMSLRSRPGSSATADQTLETTGHGERSKVKLHSEEGVSRLGSVDVNNNEYQINNSRSVKPPGIANSNRLAFVTKINHNDDNLPIETQGLNGSMTKEKNDPISRNEVSPTDTSARTESSPQGINLEDSKRSSRKSTSKSAGPDSATPSTILSQVILEEEESIGRKNGGSGSITSTSPSHSNYKQSPRGRDSTKHQTWDNIDNGNLYRLPSLYNHGKTSNANPNNSSGSFSVSGEQPGSGRNQSPWRNKPEFADLFSTRKKRHFLNSNAASESSNPNNEDMKSAAARKSEMHQMSLDQGKNNVHHSLQNSKDFKDRRHNSMRRLPSHNSNIFQGEPPMYPDKPNFLPNLSNKPTHRDGSDAKVGNGGNSPDNTKENGSANEEGYALTCTIGLPKLWKQSMDKKKDPRAEPEVSAAAIARRHRRGRVNSQSMF